MRPPRLLALALALVPLLVFGACSHAPPVAVAPEGPGAPDAPVTARGPDDAHAPDDAHEPDLGVERPHDEDSEDAPRHATTRHAEHGRASYYGAEFEGRRTASGERYDGHAMTAAHRTLPFGTRVRVTNLDNGRSVEVVVNDRGPHRAGRVIDLSRRAAKKLDMLREGTARVAVEVVDLAVLREGL